MAFRYAPTPAASGQLAPVLAGYRRRMTGAGPAPGAGPARQRGTVPRSETVVEMLRGRLGDPHDRTRPPGRLAGTGGFLGAHDLGDADAVVLGPDVAEPMTHI